MTAPRKTPRKLTQQEAEWLSYLKALPSGEEQAKRIAEIAIIAGKRIAFLESLLAEVVDLIELEEFESSGYKHLRCPACKRVWVPGSEDHAGDCLALRLRQAVQP